MRFLGLDYGDHTVGIAISDPTGLIASPLETVKRTEPENLKQTVRRIRELTETYDIHTIILGYPKNMNNTEGVRVEKTMQFKKRLERDLYQVTILLQDERLTTKTAEAPLLESGWNRFERKRVIDAMAASLILQSYLDTVNHKQKEGKIVELDEVLVLFEPEEKLKSKIEVCDTLELNGNTYFLAYVLMDEVPEGLQDEDDEEDAAFIFKICDASVHEFQVLNDDNSVRFYVTTEMDDDEEQEVVSQFMDEDGDYELRYEEDEE